MPADYQAALRRALAQAADDLEITVEFEESVRGADGTEHPVVARIAEFGSPNGIVIFDRGRWSDEAGEAAVQAVGAVSTLGPEYAKYDRDTYVQAFRDWGWFGRRQPPKWYRRRFHP